MGADNPPNSMKMKPMFLRRGAFPKRVKTSVFLIPLIYILISSAYILLSTAYFSDILEYPPDIYEIETVKGLLFVLVTAVTLAVLLYFETRWRERAQLDFLKLVESQADAVFVIQLPERVITYANRAAQELFGYSEEELVGKSTAILHVNEASFDAFDRSGAASLARGEAVQIEFEMRKKDGTVFISEHKVTKVAMSNSVAYAVSVVRNVSAQRESLMQLRDSEELFRQLAENIQEVFWMSDTDKTEMLYASPAYEKIWGRSIESLKKFPRSFIDAIHAEDRERIVASIRGQEDGLYDEEYRIVRPDGSVRWIRDRGFPITNAQGEVYRIAGLAADITADIERGNRLRQAQKLEALGQLTGGIAHDFNNLLLVILGNVELIKTRFGDNTNEAQYLQLIERAGQRAADLTNRMLIFARQNPVELTVLDVNACLAQMEQLLKPSLGEGVKVFLSLTDQPTVVQTDGSYLESSIINLAINARDAMPNGGSLTIETSVVSLTNRDVKQFADLDPGRYVEIAVSDTGTGIPAEHLQHVFDPFYSTKEVDSGTGLGLSMVHGFVRESGGQATIYSEVGVGTTVRLYLPVHGEQEAESEKDPASVESLGGTETILVVEDDNLVQSYVCTQLSSLGYKVLKASNAVEALEIVGSAPQIDLIFTDVVMPGGMSGPELIKEACVRRPELKILFTTGYSDQAAVAKMGEFNADVINKPYRAYDLSIAIRKAIDVGREEGMPD